MDYLGPKDTFSLWQVDPQIRASIERLIPKFKDVAEFRSKWLSSSLHFEEDLENVFEIDATDDEYRYDRLAFASSFTVEDDESMTLYLNLKSSCIQIQFKGEEKIKTVFGGKRALAASQRWVILQDFNLATFNLFRIEILDRSSDSCLHRIDLHPDNREEVRLIPGSRIFVRGESDKLRIATIKELVAHVFVHEIDCVKGTIELVFSRGNRMDDFPQYEFEYELCYMMNDLLIVTAEATALGGNQIRDQNFIMVFDMKDAGRRLVWSKQFGRHFPLDIDMVSDKRIFCNLRAYSIKTGEMLSNYEFGEIFGAVIRDCECERFLNHYCESSGRKWGEDLFQEENYLRDQFAVSRTHAYFIKTFAGVMLASKERNCLAVYDSWTGNKNEVRNKIDGGLIDNEIGDGRLYMAKRQCLPREHICRIIPVKIKTN